MNVIRYRYDRPNRSYMTSQWHLGKYGPLCDYRPPIGWTLEEHPDRDAQVTCDDCIRIHAEMREATMGGLANMMIAWDKLDERTNAELAALLMEHVIADTEITSPFYALFAEIHERLTAVCEWTLDFDGLWETDCGEAFTFIDGGLFENNFRFCYSCGRRIEDVSNFEEDDE